MKRLLAVLCLLFLLGTLTACNSKNEEFKNRLVVQAIGVDKAENGIKVTLQVLNTDRTGALQGNSSGETVQTVEAEGASVADALRQVTESGGKKVMMSQNRVIVLGMEIAKDGFHKAMDYFVRSSQNRATVDIAVAEGEASEVVSAKMGESIIPAKKIELALQADVYNSRTVERKVYMLMNDAEESTTAPTLPILHVQKTEDPEVSIVAVSGTALFIGDKYEQTLSPEDTRAILWLRNEMKEGALNVRTLENQNVTFILVGGRTKIRVKPENGNLRYTVQIHCELDCAQIENASAENLTEAAIKKLEKAAENAIREETTAVFQKLAAEKGADPFLFGERLEIKYPEIYREKAKDWKKALSQMNLTVEVKAKIRRVGNEAVRLK